MLDTSVAISLRDSDELTLEAISALKGDFVISSISRVELENGVYRDANTAATRRKLLDILLASITVLPFDNEDAERYGQIVAIAGWSRAKIIDRMIAAHAIQIGATLITKNGKDFAEIEGLKLEAW